MKARPPSVQRSAVLLALACAVGPGGALAIEGFPGSTWGDLHWDLPSPGDADLILQGWIRQGVAWKRWEWGGKGFRLQTYATFRYKWDTQGFDWYNILGPGVGLSIDMTEAPLFSWGVEYVYQWYDRSERSQPYAALFMNWYQWWEIAGNGYPGATWGDLRWEIPTNGTSNLILQGWIRQGVVLARWQAAPRVFALSPYLRIRYDLDSLGLSWNNKVGPGAGVALDMEGGHGPLVSWGAEYAWEKNLWSGDSTHRVEIFMRWYAWWDLLGR